MLISKSQELQTSLASSQIQASNENFISSKKKPFCSFLNRFTTDDSRSWDQGSHLQVRIRGDARSSGSMSITLSSREINRVEVECAVVGIAIVPSIKAMLEITIDQEINIRQPIKALLLFRGMMR